jgi:hypothetical protein
MIRPVLDVELEVIDEVDGLRRDVELDARRESVARIVVTARDQAEEQDA